MIKLARWPYARDERSREEKKKQNRKKKEVENRVIYMMHFCASVFFLLFSLVPAIINIFSAQSNESRE